ncbi:recombinase family protein [uncultured Sphingomonas sp.]|uniref:recombinase family protein n=1 Tax=uncultured Sphingomonas sp. TaxID=158754 RepID=UPI002625844C|nr:recombinase family protein [uncultured Sphingomonas sp.]
MPRCAIYARFSTDKQSATSAEDQVRDCRARAAREGWDVVDVYTDLAISGANNRRPGMTQMLADAAAGSFDIVIVEDLDRAARDLEDIAGIYKRLAFAGVRLWALSVGEVTELHIGLKGTMDSLELKKLAEKIRRGQRGAVSRGRVPGGLAYGYEVVAALDAKGELDRGQRRINEVEAKIIRRVYTEYLAGRSPKAIAHGLNADGIPSPRGGEWRASSIYGSRSRGLGLLHNPIYGGRFLYNRVRMVRDPETRKRLSRNNAANDRTYVDMPHLRIVDEATWQKVQDEADLRSTGPLVSHVRPKHLLTGLVKCGCCGGSMVVVNRTRIGCVRHREAGTCDVAARIDRHELEERVLAGISERLLAPEAVSHLVNRYHAAIADEQASMRKRTESIDRKIATLDKAITRLVAAIAEGGVDFVEIREAMIARKAEREALRRQKEEADAGPVIALNPRVIDAYRTKVRQLAASIRSPAANGHEVMTRLRDLIEQVTLTPLNDGAWTIEVQSSLGGVVALATTPSQGGLRRTLSVVAEEGLEPPTPGL